MHLSTFFQGDLSSNDESGIEELFRTILIRTNFVPVVRHIIGWRGVKRSVAPVECWTAKINDYPGVFGVFFNGPTPFPGWTAGRFSLLYFPHPDEDLVECCSLQAAALTQSENYLTRVREFLTDPPMVNLFTIGSLSLSVAAPGNALVLILEALSRQRSISETGVNLVKTGPPVELIAPGGCDQDFPAVAVAAGFFDVLAASVTFNLAEAPAYLREYRRPGTQQVLDRTGVSRPIPVDSIWRHTIVLGYGRGRFDDCCRPANDSRTIHRWVAGEPLPEPFAARLWWRTDHIEGTRSIDKNVLGVDERPPLILLTGFLGSGKTSFLKHFIEYQTQHSRFVAVIQNEIGAVGLDGQLLDYAVTEIDEGCVCCSLSGSLKRGIQGILTSFTPDCIVVETTGLANPFNLLEEMQELENLVRFDCTLTVVDAENIHAALAAHAMAADQVRAADILMINKKDLIGPDQLTAITDRLRRLNPRAPLFAATNGDLNPALVLQLDDRARIISRDQTTAVPHPSHLHDGLWVKTITLPEPVQRENFLEAVTHLPQSVFRIKGVLSFADSAQPMLFQYVAGRFDISRFPGDPKSDFFLTVIGHGRENSIPMAALDALTG